MNVKYLPSFMSRYYRLPNSISPDQWCDDKFKKMDLYSFCNFKLSVDIVKIAADSVDAIFEYVPMIISDTKKKHEEGNGKKYENVLYDTQDKKKFYVNGDDVDELIDIVTKNAYANIQIIISGIDTLKKCAIDILNKHESLMDIESLYINFSSDDLGKYTNVMESIRDKTMEIYNEYGQKLNEQYDSQKASAASSASQSRRHSNVTDTNEEENKEDIMETYWNKPLLTEKDGLISTKPNTDKNSKCTDLMQHCQKKMWTSADGFKPFYDHLNTGIWHDYNELYLRWSPEKISAVSLLKPLSEHGAPEGYFKICFIMQNDNKIDFSYERICAPMSSNLPFWKALFDQIPDQLFKEYINSYDGNSYVKSVFINGEKYLADITSFFSERIKKSNVAITTHKKITIYITKGGGITELKVEHEIENIVETEVKVEHEIPAMTSHLLLPVLDPTKRIPYQVSEKPLFNRSPCFNDKACVIGLEDVYSIHNAMFEHYNDIPYNPPKQVEPEPVYNLSSDPSTPIKLDNDEALVIYKIIQTDESRVNKCVYEKSIKTKKDDLLKMTWNTLFGQIGLYDGKPYGPTSVNGIPTTIVPVFYINSSPIISNSLTFDTMDIKDILSIKNENLPIKIGLHLYKLDKKLCFVMPYDANCHINAENL